MVRDCLVVPEEASPVTPKNGISHGKIRGTSSQAENEEETSPNLKDGPPSATPHSLTACAHSPGREVTAVQEESKFASTRLLTWSPKEQLFLRWEGRPPKQQQWQEADYRTMRAVVWMKVPRRSI